MLCVTCSDIHKGTDAFRDHKSEALELVEFCTTHHRINNLFCHDCDSIMCNRCAIRDHAKHCMNTISDIAEKRRARIHEIITEKKAQIDTATLALIEEQHYCTAERKMNKAFDLLQAYLEKVKSVLYRSPSNNSLLNLD